MPLPSDTAIAVGQSDTGKDNEGVDFAVTSRSLMLDRFPNPKLEKEDRRTFFANAFRKSTYTEISKARHEFVAVKLALGSDKLLFAQLQSRLMVNMAGGVMENAGMCLDRFGLPYIPGSAAKGCARRMAIQQLVEVRSAGKPIQEMVNLLVSAALVFGWGNVDWKAGRQAGRNGRQGELYSDFEFACGENESWRAVRPIVAVDLLKRLDVKELRHPDQPWEDLPESAGHVSFLPAYPVDVTGAKLPIRPPPIGTMQLDVLTCHHRKYYEGKDPGYASAPDTEEPNPVVFPALAAGHVFIFGLRTVRRHQATERPPDQTLLEFARTWLAGGLRLFGLGAKTSAGYGWFEDVTRQAVEAEEEAKAAAAAEASRIAEVKRKEEARRLMPPEQRACDDFLALVRMGKQQEFAETARSFAALDDTARKGFVMALRAEKNTVKRWKKNKPELLKTWVDFAATMNPPIPL